MTLRHKATRELVEMVRKGLPVDLTKLRRTQPDVWRAACVDAFRRSSGNLSETARALDVSVRTFMRWRSEDAALLAATPASLGPAKGAASDDGGESNNETAGPRAASG